MTNIWAFLNQTLSVSVIAVLLLVIKYILKDKLSPRWQYGVWIVLALRILVPVNIYKALFLPISVFVEHMRGLVETDVFSETSAIKYVIPYVAKQPSSVTDWIFVVYFIGVIGVLGWYFINYIRLRRLVRRGIAVPEKMKNKLHYVSAVYELNECRAIVMPGITSAFICGGIHPILVLPEDEDVDEKIILHEFLHLKYHDEWQSIIWCILRALHWCNPFLQYIFNQIGNDMEALCDQRVLERLEGEERREYGAILLSMANEKYARVPGTSSISNGGKNISKRIESIVRFKKYPKGMGLVSVCITLLLAIPSLIGSDYVVAASDYNPHNESEWNRATAIARVNRAKTVAGAITTYANGLLVENEVYMLLVSPLDKHEEIIAQSSKGDDTYFEKHGLGAGNIYFGDSYDLTYTIWNVIEKERNVYEAYIVFGVNSYNAPIYSIIVPIEVRYEDGWIVEETGERMIAPRAISTGFIVQGTDTGLSEAKQYAARCDSGEIRISTWLHYGINNSVELDDSFFSNFFNREIDTSAILDAEFTTVNMWSLAEYTCENTEDGKKPVDFFGILYKDIDSLDEKIEFEKLYVGAGSGGGSGDESFIGQPVSNGYKVDMDGLKTILREDRKEEIMDFPAGYAVRIFWDGEQVEEVIVPEAEEYVENVRLYPTFGKAQYSTKIESQSMKAFMDDVNKLEIQDENRLTSEELHQKLETWAFAEDADKELIQRELEKAGIYYFENSIMTDVLCVHPANTTIYEPKFFYDANEGNWIVLTYGYCTEDFGDTFIEREVGRRESWGVDFLTEKSIYDCGSLVTRQWATISNEDGTVRKETTNSSGSTEAGGIWYEMQDYVSKDGYVGYRWFGATTYGPGFEQMDADVVAFYNHTN